MRGFLRTSGLLLMLPALLTGQEKGVHQGDFKNGPLKGRAHFEYQIQGQDTIIQGPFQLQNSQLDHLQNEDFDYFAIEGEFKDNQADGSWLLRRGRYRPASEGALEDKRFILPLSGKETITRGNFQRGKASGEWHHVQQRLDSSQVRDSTFSARFSFQEGKPVDDFYIRDSHAYFDGHLSQESVAEDVWHFRQASQPELDQEWHFVENQLNTILLKRKDGPDDTLFSLPPRQDQALVLSSHKMDGRFFKILKIKLQWQKKDSSQFVQPAIELMRRCFQKFHEADSTLSQLRPVQLALQVNVQLRRHPFSESETRQLDMMVRNTLRADSLKRKILQNSQLKLQRLSDPDIAFYMAVAISLDRQYLEKLKTLVNYSEQGYLEYLPREIILKNLDIPREDAQIEVPMTMKNDTTRRSFHITHLKQANDGQSSLKQLRGFAEALAKNYQAIEDSLEVLMRQKKKVSTLVQLEDSLMERWEYYQNAIDSLERRAQHPVDDIDLWQAFIEHGEEELEDYAEMEDFDAKSKRARELITCFENGLQWGSELLKIPDQKGQIEKIYTRTVWNPYTYTDMEEVIKNRILDAYTEILIPFLIQEAKEEQECDEMLFRGEQLQELYARMLEFRDQNTDRLEKNLKRKKDPEDILKLMDIETE